MELLPYEMPPNNRPLYITQRRIVYIPSLIVICYLNYH